MRWDSSSAAAGFSISDSSIPAALFPSLKSLGNSGGSAMATRGVVAGR